jgi:hypothetical protein
VLLDVRKVSERSAIIRIPARSPELIVVSETICPTPSWPKATKKSCAMGP